MTSVLNVDTIADKAGTGPVALTKQFAPKAWWSSDDTVIKDSFNISSLTDVGASTYGFNFASNMSNGNYAFPGGTLNITAFDVLLTTSATSSRLTQKGMNSTNGTVQDTDPSGAAIGDLA